MLPSIEGSFSVGSGVSRLGVLECSCSSSDFSGSCAARTITAIAWAPESCSVKPDSDGGACLTATSEPLEYVYTVIADDATDGNARLCTSVAEKA